MIPADLMTKPLPRSKVEQLKSLMGRVHENRCSDTKSGDQGELNSVRVAETISSRVLFRCAMCGKFKQGRCHEMNGETV